MSDVITLKNALVERYGNTALRPAQIKEVARELGMADAPNAFFKKDLKVG